MRGPGTEPLGARMKTNLSVLTRLPVNLGSLGLGGTIGTAVGLGAYFVIPTLSDHISVQVASGLGGALGGATGAATARVLSPIVRKGSHYLLMLELDIQVRCGWLTPARAAQFRTELQKQYFGTHSRTAELAYPGLTPPRVKAAAPRGQYCAWMPPKLASVLGTNPRGGRGELVERAGCRFTESGETHD